MKTQTGILAINMQIMTSVRIASVFVTVVLLGLAAAVLTNPSTKVYAQTACEDGFSNRVYAINHSVPYSTEPNYNPYYNPDLGNDNPTREQIPVELTITADNDCSDIPDDTTTSNNPFGSGGGGGSTVRLDSSCTGQPNSHRPYNITAPETEPGLNSSRVLTTLTLIGLSWEAGGGNEDGSGNTASYSRNGGDGYYVSQGYPTCGEIRNFDYFRLLFHYTDCEDSAAVAECGGITTNDPLEQCLPDPIKRINFDEPYDDSGPPSYGPLGRRYTRQNSSETEYISHEDISSGGARVLADYEDDGPGWVELDYTPYVQDYPYDNNQAAADYLHTYRERKYTATGKKVYRDVYEYGLYETNCKYVIEDGAIVYSCDTVFGYHDTGEDEYVGRRYVLRSDNEHTETLTEKGPTMSPCYTRTFDGTPTASGINLTPDQESPNKASIRGGVRVVFGVQPGTTSNRSDVRRASSIEIPYSIQLYIRRADGTLSSTSGGDSDSPELEGTNRTKVDTDSTSQPIDKSISVPGTMEVGDKICARVTIGSPEQGEMNVAGSLISGGGTQSSGLACTPPVVNWPYFKVFGNDVVSGGSFGTCSASGGRISAFSRSGSLGVGSSTQFAAFALGTISGFSSASLKPIGQSPAPPTGLTFANSGVSGEGGSYSANDGMTCLPSYFDTEGYTNAGVVGGSNATQSNEIVNRLSQTNDNPRELEYIKIGNSLNLSSGATIPVAKGSRKVIFVDGDLNISSNVTFDTAWNERDDIPFVMFAARNVTFGSGVSQLDGVYVAQPVSPGNGGVIRTCDATGSGVFNACRNPLVVNGALIADTIELMRTRGSLRDARLNEGRAGVTPVNVAGNCSWTVGPTNVGTVGGTTCAAEVISFSPEVYMSISQLLTPEENFRYDSYVVLPPNL